jgi:DNA-binding IclR family transcriptional regulator
MPAPDRQDDEAVLRVLDLHAAGCSIEQIAEKTGLIPAGARRLISSVVRDDCAHDLSAIAYWVNP